MNPATASLYLMQCAGALIQCVEYLRDKDQLVPIIRGDCVINGGICLLQRSENSVARNWSRVRSIRNSCDSLPKKDDLRAGNRAAFPAHRGRTVQQLE